MLWSSRECLPNVKERFQHQPTRQKYRHKQMAAVITIISTTCDLHIPVPQYDVGVVSVHAMTSIIAFYN